MKTSSSSATSDALALVDLANCRSAFAGVATFSAIINLLALTSSFYMLQVYDRVLPSRSVPTLIGLTVLMLVLYAAYGALDAIRARVTSRIGMRLDRALRGPTFAAVLRGPLLTRPTGDGLQPARDLDQVRNFLTSGAPVALFDMPWLPFYLALVFLLHPWLGVLGLTGAGVLIGLAWLTEMKTRETTRVASASGAERHAALEAGRRNAEVIQALGMDRDMSERWSKINETYLKDQVGGADVASLYSALSKVFRFILQSAVLGLGAYLVINGQASGGVMIASSILISRALAPIEMAIANWRNFVAARQSATRLMQLMRAQPDSDTQLTLPKASKELTVEGLFVAAPGQQRPIVQNVSLRLDAGAGLGIIGSSASGKSSLVRAIVGAWRPLRGSVRLDGAALDQWPTHALGQNIGYMPQDVELIDGTIAENIARFQPGAKSEDVIAAAQAAAVHDLIVRLPEGYNTRIGEGGMALSAGQRQRIALARALYGDPFLVVLDEPNSNLDAEGEAALARAVTLVRYRGGIVIVIAHRPSALSVLDQVLVMAEGQVQAFGPKDEILRKATMAAGKAPPAPNVPAGGAPIVVAGRLAAGTDKVQGMLT